MTELTIEDRLKSIAEEPNVKGLNLWWAEVGHFVCTFAVVTFDAQIESYQMRYSYSGSLESVVADAERTVATPHIPRCPVVPEFSIGRKDEKWILRTPLKPDRFFDSKKELEEQKARLEEYWGDRLLQWMQRYSSFCESGKKLGVDYIFIN